MGRLASRGKTREKNIAQKLEDEQCVTREVLSMVVSIQGLEYFIIFLCPKQGQDLIPLVTRLHPDVGRVFPYRKCSAEQSVCTSRRQILKSKNKEPLKVLPSSGIRGTKFISAYNVPSQQRQSFGNQHILNFEVVAVRDTKEVFQHGGSLRSSNFERNILTHISTLGQQASTSTFYKVGKIIKTLTN